MGTNSGRKKVRLVGTNTGHTRSACSGPRVPDRREKGGRKERGKGTCHNLWNIFPRIRWPHGEPERSLQQLVTPTDYSRLSFLSLVFSFFFALRPQQTSALVSELQL